MDRFELVVGDDLNRAVRIAVVPPGELVDAARCAALAPGALFSGHGAGRPSGWSCGRHLPPDTREAYQTRRGPKAAENLIRQMLPEHGASFIVVPGLDPGISFGSA